MSGNDYNALILFSIQLDEATAAAEETKLFVFIQHTEETNLKQDITMQICKSHTPTLGEDMFCGVDTYSKAQPLPKLVAFCTAREAPMMRKQKGFNG